MNRVHCAGGRLLPFEFEEKTPVTDVMSWRIGEVRISRVLEFEMPVLSPKVLYPDITAEQLDRNRDWLEPYFLNTASNLLMMAIHSFVIETPASVIMVDTCSGNDRSRPKKLRYHQKKWPYLQNLGAAGYRPEDIDFVLCTHLHADHVGWNTHLRDGRWVPTFPNARYLFAARELEHWQNEKLRHLYTDDPYFEDSMLPILDGRLADLVGMDHVIDDFVRLEPSHGHTPGHVCVRITSAGDEAVMSGDIMHTPLQCAEPELNSCFCVDLSQARQTRRDFIERHAGSNVLIMPAHFPTPVAGLIERRGDRFRFKFGRG
jgi:glyoxylase-like metal-dependent hydrolase (beta-lactamase superfamily II)